MIIFLVDFLKHSSKKHISINGLELAVQDLIDEKEFKEKEKEKIRKILETNPEFLISEKCEYFKMIKPYLLPFIAR